MNSKSHRRYLGNGPESATDRKNVARGAQQARHLGRRVPSFSPKGPSS